MPALHAAYAIYQAAASFQRWEIEARLLTDESFAQIAAKCASDGQSIEVYHATFFDVRERLRTEGYVLHQVLGPRVHAGLTEADVDVLLKTYAHAGGSHTVDALVRYYREPPTLPERPETLEPGELQELRTKLLIKAAILAHTLPAKASALKQMVIVAGAVRVIQTALRQGNGPGSLVQPLQVSLDRLLNPRDLHKDEDASEGSDDRPSVTTPEPLPAA
jgi:hypothetical protein